MKRFGSVTPDEKLLNIIEKTGDGNKAIKVKKSKIELKRFFDSIGVVVRKISLHGVNKLLIWVSIIATASLAFYFFKEEKKLEDKFEVVTNQFSEKESSYSFDMKKDMPDLRTYLSETERNNPFHVLPEITKPKKKEEPLASQLSLVGIIWSSDRPQAIIEDKTKAQNHLVYEGDVVEKYTITKITKTEVILTSEDGEKTLR